MGFFKNALDFATKGGLVGGVVSGVGNAIAGSVLNRGYEAQREAYNNWINDRRAVANKTIYEDSTQNAQNQAVLNQTQQMLNQQTQQTQRRNAVTGGTDESVALDKAAAAATAGNMMAQQAAQAQARKDTAQQQLNTAEDNYASYIAASRLQQAQGKAKAISDSAAATGQSLNNYLNPPIK